MNVGILCSNTGGIEHQQLAKAFSSIGITPFFLDPASLSMGVNLDHSFFHPKVSVDEMDGFLIRGIGISLLNRCFFRFDLLHALESRGYRLINSAMATERSFNKSITSIMLDANTIPTPSTVIAEDLKHAIAAFDRLGGDVLVKPVYGSQGVGMFRLQERGYAERVLMELYQLGSVFYLQEFLESASPPGEDIPNPCDARLFLVGTECIAAMIRESASPSTWKANVHAGGTPRPFNPPREAVDLAIKAASTMGVELAGIDMIYSREFDDWIVIEVNSCPGWTGLSTVSDVDVPRAIAMYYHSQLGDG